MKKNEQEWKKISCSNTDHIKDPAIIKEFNLIHSPSSIKFNLVFYRYTYSLINI